MISYILKSGECLGFLFLLYRFVLSREKMLRFNRFYLLFSIGISLAIPLIRYTPAAAGPGGLMRSAVEAINIHTAVDNQLSNTGDEYNFSSWIFAIAGLYTIGVLFKLIQFIRNIILLQRQKRDATSCHFHDAIVYRVAAPIPSCSFMKSIFISENDYQNETVRNSLLSHEYSHVRQKHSWDVMALELVQVFLWFNPIIVLYKRAIRLNHEFSADADAAEATNDMVQYGELLLSKAAGLTGPQFASSFNYPIIKKRMIMLYQTTSSGRAAVKQAAVIPFIAVAIVFFTDKVIAQQPPVIRVQDVRLDRLTYSKEGVSKELMEEYEATLEKFRTVDKKGYAIYDVPESDRKRLGWIFTKMSRAQQKSVQVDFFAPPPPLPRITPTDSQFESFKDPKVYGVWINNKKVANDELSKYKASDFAQVFVSKLYSPAYTPGKHTHQVDLMTTDFYEKYRANELAKDDLQMSVRRFKPAEQRKKNK